MFCFFSSSLASHLPGTDVKLLMFGGAETSAFTKMLSASVEGQSSPTQLRCGAARCPTAQGKEGGVRSTSFGLVSTMKKGRLESSASMGRRST